MRAREEWGELWRSCGEIGCLIPPFSNFPPSFLIKLKARKELFSKGGRGIL
jgi:hypothetical protein